MISTSSSPNNIFIEYSQIFYKYNVPKNPFLDSKKSCVPVTQSVKTNDVIAFGSSAQRSTFKQSSDSGTPLSLKKPDFFFDVPAFIAYYQDPEAGGMNFNTASLAVPVRVVREEAQSLAKQDSRLDELSKKDSALADHQRESYYRRTREAAAGLLRSQPAFPPKQIVLARNTTEASSMAFWLAALQPGDNVLFSTAEHISVKQAFRRHDDHGCPGDSNHASWARFYSQRGKKYDEMMPTLTGINIKTFNPSAKNIAEELGKHITKATKILVISHVDRATGKIFPVKEIIQAARKIKPDIFILVDGAQTLGSLPIVDFDKLGCDAYLASPHKPMGSEVCGLMYVSPKKYPLENFSEIFNRLSAKNEQVILKGVFDPSTGIRSNVNDSLALGDTAVLPTAIDYLTKNHGLQGADFNKISQHREECRNYLSQKLRQLPLGETIRIEIPPYDNCTSFIMNLKISNINQRKLAEILSAQKIFLTYLGEQDCYRISFQPSTSKKELDCFIEKLVEEILKLSPKKLNFVA